MENEGKYIYCIIEDRVSRIFDISAIGATGGKVYSICSHDLAVVVSNSPIMEYSSSRENLITHEKVIEAIMAKYTVLPVRFCTIAENEKKIKGILDSEHEKFKELLNKIKGKKELGLKVLFEKDMIYKDILEKYGNIKVLKEKIAALPSQASYYQRVEIGKMVEAALQEEKQIYKKEILDALTPLAQEVKINATFGERMLLNAAFFVQETKEAEFDKTLDELDEKYGSKMKFKYVGTLPPFNFVSVIINTRFCETK